MGCIIIVMQLNPLLGQPGVNDTVTAARAFLPSLSQGNPWTVLVAGATMAICYFTPQRLRSIAPAELFALVLGSVAVTMVGIGLPLLEQPEMRLPIPTWPPLAELRWGDIWIASLVLALISSLESLVTSMAADSATRTFHDSNKELMGQGIGNFVAGVIGVIPGAGATSRTMVNIRAGGVSPLSALTHSALLLGLLLVAGHLIQYIPAAVLAGILIYIGLRIVDWRYIQRFKYAPPSSVLIMLVVWVLAVFVSVVAAVAVGVIMASLVLVKRMDGFAARLGRAQLRVFCRTRTRRSGAARFFRLRGRGALDPSRRADDLRRGDRPDEAPCDGGKLPRCNPRFHGRPTYRR